MTTFTKFKFNLNLSIATIMFLLMVSMVASAQPYYSLSTDIMHEDESHSVQVTPIDGGTITTGYSVDPTGKSFLNIVKYDAFGAVIWSSIYDWGTDKAVGNAIELTSDGGYIVAGRVISPTTGVVNALLLKIGPGGAPMWSEIYDFSSPYAEAFSVEEVLAASPTGARYVWTGTATNGFNGTLDHVTVTTDGFGSMLSVGILDSTEDEEGRSVKPWIDPASGVVMGYATCGHTTFGAPGKNATMTMFDPTLSVILWDAVYGGFDDEEANALEVLPGGEAFVTGYSNSYSNGAKDIFTTMFAPGGPIIWSTIVGRQLDEVARSIELLSTGELVVAGWTNYAAGKRHQGVIGLLDPTSGALITASAYGKSEDDEFFSVKETFTAAGTLDIVATGFFGADISAAGDDRDLFNVRTDLPLIEACATPLPYSFRVVNPLVDNWPLPPGVFGYSTPEPVAMIPVVTSLEDRCCDCSAMMVSFTPSSTAICAGDIVDFINTSGCVDEFRWSVNGVVVAYGPVFSYVFPSTGTYTVTLDGRNAGCPIASYSTTIVVSCSPKIGAAGMDAEGISLVPNPANTVTTIDADMGHSLATEAQMSVMDLSGRTLQQQQVAVENGRVQQSIDVSQLPEGMYIIRIETADFSTTSRLAVTH